MTAQSVWFGLTLGLIGWPAGMWLRRAAHRLLLERGVSVAQLRFPAAEIAASALFAWAGWHYGFRNAEWVVALLLAAVLVVTACTDMRAMIIPNRIIVIGLALTVAARAAIHPLPFWNYAAAAAGGFGLLYAVAWASRGGIGGGDIKLYLIVGFACGLSSTVLSLFIASVIGALYGLSASLRGKTASLKQTIPFGPCIGTGAFLSLLYGEAWITPYLDWLSR